MSSELRAAHPEVPWGDIIGMRHIAHGCFDIDPDVIWNVIDRDVATLESALVEVAGD